jgi:CheY-like chemotaxis protein/HPt (histidine-containing phosphotransfer) domain-containing protein
MGFRADAVANGQEAIQALKMAPYDIVFMDVQMPVMDGFEATRQIRNPQSAIRNHKIPIIAMTAHAMKGDRERCLEAGMDDYVPKPISPQALASAIENWLDRAQEQPPAVPPPVGETQLSEGPPVFDRQALKDRLMGDDELVKEIIAGFLEDVPKQIRRLREHVGQGQAGLAGSQAHTIKGAAANVGGMALGAVASAVEKAGNKGRLEEIAALMPELERQFDRLKEAMEKEI